MTLLRHVWCGCYLAYLPKWGGGGELGERSRRFCYAVKRGDEGKISGIAKHVRHHRNENGVRKVLGPDAALVPMPRSAPLAEGALWPASMLAEALLRQGLGGSVLPLVERTHGVKKSATAPPGERPTAADHLKSFRVSRRVFELETIVIVDDVVTSGATMLAAASAVSEAIPGVTIRGFAFIRTHSKGDVEAILSPVLSQIRLLPDGRTLRDP